MKDVMLDFETLGTRAGCAIISAGLVGFDPKNGDMDEGVYIKMEHEYVPGMKLPHRDKWGLEYESGTVAWWEAQSAAAREVLLPSPIDVPLDAGLEQLYAYLSGFGVDVRLWGNGANFDQPILTAAAHACGVKPWGKFYNERCYRTVKNMAKQVEVQRQGVHHNALDDAKTQAQHLMDIVRNTVFVLA